MTNNENTVEYIGKNKIIAIIRGVGRENIIPLVRAIYDGGIRLCEVTFDHSGKFDALYTADMIKKLCDEFDGRMLIGAGTVLSRDEVRSAHGAGAKFIISPDTDREVIGYTKELGMVSIPGALTPTEIVSAYKYGADIVKVFPLSALGPGYIKDVKTPLSNIPLVAVGKVTPENAADYIRAGADGVGVSSTLVNAEYIAKGEYDKIEFIAKAYVDAVAGA